MVAEVIEMRGDDDGFVVMSFQRADDVLRSSRPRSG